VPEEKGLPRLGKQPRRYHFVLNPYTDVRFTTCPRCHALTRLRKVPLVIHVDPLNPLALNKTCRYCPACDLLIVHQDELEAVMAAAFAERAPEVIGNDYLVIGTLDRPDWLRGTKSLLSIAEMIEALHDFRSVRKLESAGGWERVHTGEPERRSRRRSA
jgi:hypothetical protein